MSNATYNLELNHKPNKEGLHMILLRVTINRKPKRIKTGIEVKEGEYNKIADFGKWIRKSNPQSVSLNNKLVSFINDAKSNTDLVSEQNQTVTPSNIVTSIKSKYNYTSFYEYFKMKVDQYEHLHSYNYYKDAKAKLNQLTEFLGSAELFFADVTVSWLNTYEVYLIKEKKLHTNTIAQHLKMIRKVFNDAKLDGVYNKHQPFGYGAKMLKHKETIKKKLDIEDLKNIEDLVLTEGTNMFHTRNMFLFSFYLHGIRVGDLLQIKKTDVRKGILTYETGKNNRILNIGMPEKALAIYNYYKNENKESIRLFPFLENEYSDDKELDKAIGSKTSTLNNNLADIAKKLEIGINLTMHIARHSYADLLRQNKVSVFDISKMLGHSNVSITERYLNGLDTKEADATSRNLIDSF